MRIADLLVAKEWPANWLPFQTFVRQVRDTLNGGVRLREQSFGDVRSFVWPDSPIVVSSSLKTAPLAVLCLSSRPGGAQTSTVTQSGLAVTWAWVGGTTGALRIDDIAGLANGCDVTIWIVGG